MPPAAIAPDATPSTAGSPRPPAGPTGQPTLTPPGAAPADALAGALLARHAPDWTLLLADAELATAEPAALPSETAIATDRPPDAPFDAPWEADGAALPLASGAVDQRWPLVSAHLPGPAHPLARVLARLPASLGGAPGAGRPLTDRPTATGAGAYRRRRDDRAAWPRHDRAA